MRTNTELAKKNKAISLSAVRCCEISIGGIQNEQNILELRRVCQLTIEPEKSKIKQLLNEADSEIKNIYERIEKLTKQNISHKKPSLDLQSDRNLA